MIGCRKKSERATGCNRRAKCSGHQMILGIVEAALTLAREIEIAIPVVWRRLGLYVRNCGIAQQIERRRAVERGDAQSPRDRLDAHLPIAGVGDGVIIAIVHQRFEREFDRLVCAAQTVEHARGVRALRHPNAFFELNVVTERERPHRNRAFEVKSYGAHPALRSDRAIVPAIGGKLECLPRDARDFFDLCCEQRSPDRRFERGNQQTVIAARQHAGNRARGIAADAVGHQPFARASRGEVAGDFAAQIHRRVR